MYVRLKKQNPNMQPCCQTGRKYAFALREIIKANRIHRMLVLKDVRDTAVRRRNVFENNCITHIDLHCPGYIILSMPQCPPFICFICFRIEKFWFKLENQKLEYWIDPLQNDSEAVVSKLLELIKKVSTVYAVAITDHEMQRQAVRKIFKCCEQGLITPLMETLAEEYGDPTPVTVTGKVGRSALHIAALNGRLQIVKLLSSIEICKTFAVDSNVHTGVWACFIHVQKFTNMHTFMNIDQACTF